MHSLEAWKMLQYSNIFILSVSRIVKKNPIERKLQQKYLVLLLCYSLNQKHTVTFVLLQTETNNISVFFFLHTCIKRENSHADYSSYLEVFLNALVLSECFKWMEVDEVNQPKQAITVQSRDSNFRSHHSLETCSNGGPPHYVRTTCTKTTILVTQHYMTMGIKGLKDFWLFKKQHLHTLQQVKVASFIQPGLLSYSNKYYCQWSDFHQSETTYIFILLFFWKQSPSTNHLGSNTSSVS